MNKALSTNNKRTNHSMKKFIIGIVACLISISQVFAQNRIAKSSVNLRTKANTTSSVLDVVHKGVSVYVICDLPNGWSQVIYNYQIGYINSSYLSEGPYYSARYYTNSFGEIVQSPSIFTSVPNGATARCVDGTYSFSRSRNGTCSHHGGVAEWL